MVKALAETLAVVKAPARARQQPRRLAVAKAPAWARQQVPAPTVTVIAVKALARTRHLAVVKALA